MKRNRDYLKTGKEVPCFVCKKPVYKCAGYLARGYQRITCGSPECKRQRFIGENNPFWGKVHDDETRLRIRKARAARPPKNTGPRKGIFKHSPEAREKIRVASKAMWTANRDKMIASLRREIKPRELLRYRRNFTPTQRIQWKGTHCVWCSTTEKLVLDHIIPVMCGGTRERRNCQTLCQPCNLWKMKHVDRPYMLASC